MIKQILFSLLSTLAFVLAACGAPTPAPTPQPPTLEPLVVTREVTVEVTREVVVTPTPDLSMSPIGSVALEQEVIQGNPGDEFGDILSLTTTGADQFAFPGYICSTEADGYGIGHVTISSGGIASDTTQTFGVEIWPDSKVGDKCDGVINVWLYKGDTKYELAVPVKIIVQ